MSTNRAEITNRQSQLSVAKQALLARRLQGKSQATLDIAPRDPNEPAPLSSAQQRLWFLHEFDPDNAFYNEPIAVKLQGNLDIYALEQSLNLIISRHEALRTNFITSDGQPTQVIRPSLKIPIQIANLQQLSAVQQQETIAQTVIAETHQPFNLNRDPLLRLRLMQLSATESVLLLVAHHIVFDGWSLGILMRELAEFYPHFAQNKSLSLPEVPIQYADFALWQHRWLQGEEFQQQLAYWQKQLQSLPVLELPTDKPRSAVQNFRGAKYFFQLSLELSQSLKTLSQQHNVTLFMTLLAAFQVLLSRYSNQEETAISTVVANRNRSEIEATIGVFVNTLVLRTYLGDNPTFSQLLARVREVTLEAYAHQDLPFEKLVQAIDPERSLSRSPLFQVMFALNNAPLPPLQLGDLDMIPLDVDSQIAKFDLDLSLTETEAGLTAAIEYDTDLFTPEAIARMMDNWQTLLASIVANPEGRVADLNAIDGGERRLLREWGIGNEASRRGATPCALTKDKRKDTGHKCEDLCIHQLIEKRMRENPQAIAVTFEERQLTYQELDEKANKLAFHLQNLGVAPETLVGLCVERSFDLVVGILGIWKAGGAYIPLDPSYPPERLAFMLEDARVSLLVTQSHLTSTLPSHNAHTVCIDTLPSAIDPTLCVSSPLSPQNLAYVIYTSGSTGKPKAVMVKHRSAVNAYLAWDRAYQLDSMRSHLQMASFSFDVFVGDLLRALGSGGKLVICPRDFLLSPPDLYALMRRHQIDCAEFVPAVLRNLIQYLEETGQNLDFMKLLVCGSDTWYGGEYAKFKRSCGLATRLINSFGVTEATIDSSFFESQDIGIASEQFVPIGKPFAGTELYILDARCDLVPLGAYGELYIGGAGLAEGYRDRPELTAEKFVPHPFSNEPGARLYRTGDLARYLPDGNIEFKGRIDYQAKIRGYRLELGEVEAAICQYPDVKETVALVREDLPGDKRLVAYVAPAVDLAALRLFLVEKLPSQMLPSSFVFLDALPLTPNGKIDRRALPIPDRLEVSDSFAPPKNPIEAALVEIWAEVLNLPQVGTENNFFELGGDSILSIAVISKADKRGLRLTPKQLFQHQTIAELAAVVDTAPQIIAEQGTVTGKVPLTPIQHWFFEQNFAEMHYWNQSLRLSVDVGTNWQALEKAIAALLTHHDVLRMQFSRQGDTWQQVCRGVGDGEMWGGVGAQSVAPLQKSDRWYFEFFDLSHLSPSARKLEIERVEAELQASLNLETGCLLRVAVFDWGDRPLLSIIIHHLVVDGVSWRILLEDLQTAYQQLSQNLAVSLPPKTTSFQHWAEKLTAYANNSELASEWDFWQQEIPQPAKTLCLDFPQGSNKVADSQTVSVKLSAAETEVLLKQVPAAYRTQINDVLLTALVQTFQEWTGQPYLWLDLEGHGREEISPDLDLSRTVGWFTTVFSVFLDFRGVNSPDPGKALQAVKEQLRAIPQRGFNYGVLKYLTEENVGAQRLAPVQISPPISFNYLGQFDPSFSNSSWLQLEADSQVLACSPEGHRSYLLEIDCRILTGELEASWTYSQSLHDRATIEGLATTFIAKLKAIAHRCQSPDAGGYTPSDFPLARLTQAQLDTTFKNIEDAYPLSPMQQGMLFHTLLSPDTGVYADCLRFDLEGELDAIAFYKAWESVIQRHPVLRTAFVWQDLESPLQVVYPQVQIPWEVRDWRQLSEAEKELKISQLLETERKQGFEVSQAPLMRFYLIRQSENRYHFIWTAHHLLLDGWSLPLIFQEVISSYQDPNFKPPSPPAYRNYIAWLQQQDISLAERFWKEKLKGFTAPIRLPGDAKYGDRSYQMGECGDCQISLPVPLVEALERLAKQHRLTLNTILQGAWAILLSRYSRESDLVFGAVVSGRPASLKSVESTIGNFINTLPVRVGVEPTCRLLPWLQNLQQQQIEARDFEYTPLSEIQKWSDVAAGVPLFENLFVFENYPSSFGSEHQLVGLEVRSVPGFDRTNYPLELTVEVGTQHTITLTYDRDRFESESMAGMLGHFQTLLESIISKPEARLQYLQLIADRERQQLIEDWSGVKRSHQAENLCIHELFERQVRETPDAIALVCGSEQLTYQELDERANNLASNLQILGVAPETLVGLCVERSFDTIVGILGILKAGGAYVPLDPSYPAERLAFMLSDSRSPVLVTQEHLVSSLPEHNARIVCIDREFANRKFSPVPVTCQNLAYVIYTSGSTGQPKGTCISHQSLVSFTQSAIEMYGISASDRVLQFASISFDAAAEEIYPCLATGATLVLRDDDMLASAPTFAQRCQDLGITFLDLPTAYWHQLIVSLAAAGLKLPDSVRLTVIGGEEAKAESLISWQQCANNSSLVNTYGPTEATVVATAYPVPRLAKAIDIGRSIGGVETYILDSSLQPVPVGIPGELYLGGNNLARGYLNRPELTAKKFIPHPFSQEVGARLYRTGDLVRYLPNGNIEFLGRVDKQVKIRGFRVELAEIEATLQQYPSIETSAVVLRESPSGNRCLVAYVVSTSIREFSVSNLRHFLQAKLPDYAIPAAFVRLDKLPLTPNGKIDFSNLPEWEDTRPVLEVAYLAPQTETEKIIADIWRKVLQIEEVGINDNFFELGGNSLLTIKVNGWLRERFKVSISLVEMFRLPTIKSLASYLNNSDGDRSSSHDISASQIQAGKERRLTKLQKMRSLRDDR